LTFVLIIGTPERFRCGKQVGSYVGLIPSEDSSADKQGLGHISKQGSALLRFLLVEAAQAAARSDPEWRRRYLHLAMRRQKSIAKVAQRYVRGLADAREPPNRRAKASSTEQTARSVKTSSAHSRGLRRKKISGRWRVFFLDFDFYLQELGS
jgi:hypothetical protein